MPIGRAACDTEDDLVDACGGAAGESPDSPFDNVIAEVGIPPGSGEGMEASLGMYVVSLRAKGQYRCLHRVGACHLRPGVDYRRYRTLGVELPKAKDYDGDCKRCFTKGGLDPQEQGSSSTSGSSSDEESKWWPPGLHNLYTGLTRPGYVDPGHAWFVMLGTGFQGCASGVMRRGSRRVTG